MSGLTLWKIGFEFMISIGSHKWWVDAKTPLVISQGDRSYYKEITVIFVDGVAYFNAFP